MWLADFFADFSANMSGWSERVSALLIFLFRSMLLTTWSQTRQLTLRKIINQSMIKACSPSTWLFIVCFIPRDLVLFSFSIFFQTFHCFYQNLNAVFLFIGVWDEYLHHFCPICDIFRTAQKLSHSIYKYHDFSTDS